jgi:carboxylate-amine ligase
LHALVDRLEPALNVLGDYDMVRAEVERVLTVGNGAMRQQRAWKRREDVADVTAEVAAATVEGL